LKGKPANGSEGGKRLMLKINSNVDEKVCDAIKPAFVVVKCLKQAKK
jgi:hypothetical protein